MDPALADAGPGALLVAGAVAVVVAATGAARPADASAVQAEIRAVAVMRDQALVDADMAALEKIHAGDYQLITPTGTPLSKEQYLGLISSGALRYRAFEPVSEIAVRLGADYALLRYQAHIRIEEGDHTADFVCWHIDSYELRDGHWQAVWSQATKAGA